MEWKKGEHAQCRSKVRKGWSDSVTTDDCVVIAWQPALGLAATDRRLLPYGAPEATFRARPGCLPGPSVLYLATKAAWAVRG